MTEIAEPQRSSRVLTDDQIRKFEDDGFLWIPGFLDRRETQALSDWVDELAEYPERPGRHMVYRENVESKPGARVLCRIENFCPFHQGLNRLVNSHRVLNVVSALFGEPVVLFKDKINFKMPGGGGFKAHQDVQAGWDQYAERHITMLIGIDAATVHNGCLELVPGAHRRGLIGDMWTPLDESDEGLGYQPLPTQPGDAVLFDSFVPHRSAPNESEHPRRVLYVTYNRASEGDQRARYYADKRASYPPDCERDPNRKYVFRV